jgi:hypothetical protein
MPYESKTGRLVVFERSGRWAVSLRRELSGTGVRVWEARTLPDCGELMAESPASFAVLEFRRRIIDELLDCISGWQAVYPMFRFCMAAGRELASYKWFMHEMGASGFICSEREMGTVARMACRHLAHVPPLPQSLTERIWANLPWGRGN